MLNNEQRRRELEELRMLWIQLKDIHLLNTLIHTSYANEATGYTT